MSEHDEKNLGTLPTVAEWLVAAAAFAGLVFENGVIAGVLLVASGALVLYAFWLTREEGAGSAEWRTKLSVSVALIVVVVILLLLF